MMTYEELVAKFAVEVIDLHNGPDGKKILVIPARVLASSGSGTCHYGRACGIIPEALKGSMATTTNCLALTAPGASGWGEGELALGPWAGAGPDLYGVRGFEVVEQFGVTLLNVIGSRATPEVWCVFQILGVDEAKDAVWRQERP